MFFQKKSTKIISAVLVVAIMLTMVMSTTAEMTFTAYDYDWFGDTYPIQSGYIVDSVITGSDLGLDVPLRGPRDMFIFEQTGEIFIVDTDNNRIIITNRNFGAARVLDTFYYRQDYQVENFIGEVDQYGNVISEEAYWREVNKIGTETTLMAPTGIYVTNFRGRTRMYIADSRGEVDEYGNPTGNGRVIACDLDGGIWMEYRRPTSDAFDANANFNPSKVLIDNVGNVYVCDPNTSRGAIRFSENGIFLGYFGANRVSRTADAMLNYVLRFILPRDVMLRRMQATPVEFSNFTIDHEQFVYTVTKSRAANLDIVKKLNPAGENIFEEQGYDNFIWGDFTSPFAYGKYYHSLMEDIAVDEKGDIFLLDSESNQVFQYDKEGQLMFVFGGRRKKKGLFNSPSAIETFQDMVYILDSNKNSITVFRLTEFGSLVMEAMSLFNRGLYQESLEPWQEVLRRDANYYMAYIGMGNAMLSIGEFRESLNYFYRHSRGGYGRAFKDFRVTYIRDNFNTFFAIGAAAVGLLVGTHVALIFIKKKRKEAKQGI
jgi:hypothetical protein